LLNMWNTTVHVCKHIHVHVNSNSNCFNPFACLHMYKHGLTWAGMDNLAFNPSNIEVIICEPCTDHSDHVNDMTMVRTCSTNCPINSTIAGSKIAPHW
jgi:hypothetical protein